jgi:CBS domain-containing protein
MDAVLVVGGVLLGYVILATLAYMAGRTRARQTLEERSLEAALATKVEAMMSHPVVVVSSETTVGRAAEILLGGGFGSLPVVDAAGRLAGIVTESDLTGTTRRGSRMPSLRPPADTEPTPSGDQWGERPVSEVMNPRVVTASPADPVADVTEMMVARGIRHVPVVEGDVPVGMLTRHDLLSRLITGRRD